jgi:uncharacterized protein
VRIAITGSSGLIGSALARSLEGDGHDVLRLVRPGSGDSPGAVGWDPSAGEIDAAGLDGLDGVVHLAGEPVAARRWTDAQKQRILESRTTGTTLLATTLAALHAPPPVLVSASGMDYYGDRGDEVLTEASGRGEGFLADVTAAWEGATGPAAAAGIRVTTIRTSIVLDPSGGALAKMLPLFKLGVGGRIGPGTQWWSWITLDDEVRAIRFLLENEVPGPANLAAPDPVTNADFTEVLGRVLRRPTLLPVPRFGPKLLLGAELADNLLLTSKRLSPAALLDAGFEFHHPDLETGLRATLDKPA